MNSHIFLFSQFNSNKLSITSTTKHQYSPNSIKNLGSRSNNAHRPKSVFHVPKATLNFWDSTLMLSIFFRILWLNIIKQLGLLWVFFDLRLATGLVSSIQRWEEWGVKGPIFTRSSCQLEGQMLRFGCEVYVALCLFYCFFIFLIIYIWDFFRLMWCF